MDNLSSKYPIPQNVAAGCAVRETEAKIHTQFNPYSPAVYKIVLYFQLSCEGSGMGWELEDGSWSCQLYFTDDEKALGNLSDSP